MRVVVGLKARTGRAVLVALGCASDRTVVVERLEFKTVPEGEWAPYHAAHGLDPAAARKQVERSIVTSHRMAEAALREAVQRITAAGHAVAGCAILVGTGMPPWSTEEILAVHVRIHKAEGELFRNILLAGARACGLTVATFAEKTVLDDAARSLGCRRPDLEARVAALGKTVGAPWGKDQKEAAAAACAAWYGCELDALER